MMMTLLVLKNRIRHFYEKHYHIVRCIIKFLIMFFASEVLTHTMEYNTFFQPTALLVLVSVVAAVTPDMVSVLFLVVMACGEIVNVSVLLCMSFFILFLVYLLLIGRLDARQYYVIVAIPVLAFLRISYTVPLIAACVCTPAMLPALLMGIFTQYLMMGIMDYGAATATGGSVQENVLSALRYVIDYVIHNEMWLITMIAFTLTFLCVYFIRCAAVKYGMQIAILVGAIVLMTVELLSNIIWNLNLAIGYLFIQVLISTGLAYIVQFFSVNLDYRGTKKLQFEDDEYFYYVTAVPKYKVADAEHTVTTISSEE